MSIFWAELILRAVALMPLLLTVASTRKSDLAFEALLHALRYDQRAVPERERAYHRASRRAIGIGIACVLATLALQLVVTALIP